MGAIDEIRDRLDIIDLISPHVPLRKAGKNFKGVCPFHQEKTPSFVVYPEDWGYHCFGCGAHGSGLDFIMAVERIDFGEALRVLAQRAGVTLQETRHHQEVDSQRERLHQINESAAQYFHNLLVHPTAGTTARAYLEGRGLQSATWESWQLGYSADSWDDLLGYLRRKGYETTEVVAAGLAIEREEGGVYDRFRNRLMFTIRDRDGKLTGFGARALGDAQPKYLNSPQTAVFDKGSILFGIDKAKTHIRRLDQVIIMEGYFDVIVAHQHGVENAVACMGTALTDKQLGILKRMTKNFYFALDADSAGDNATLKGIELSKQVLDHKSVPVPNWRGLIRYETVLDANIRIIEMPKGKDPDEVIGAGTDLWQRLVNDALPVTDYLFRAATANLDLSDPRAKSEAVAQLLPAIRDIPDPVVQAHYLQRLSRIVGMKERALQSLIRTPGKVAQDARRTSSTTPPEASEPILPRRAIRDEGSIAEQFCLALLLQHPELRSKAPQIEMVDFVYPGNRDIVLAWRQGDTVEGARESLEPALRERVEELTQFPLLGLPTAQIEQALSQCLQRLRKRTMLREEQELLEHELTDAVAAGDEERAALLSQKMVDLNRKFIEVLNLRFKKRQANK